MRKHSFNYLGYGASIMADPLGFVNSMMASVNAQKQENRNKAAGIELNGDLYGVPSKGIEFKFSMLDFDGNFYQGVAEGKKYIFLADGTLFLSGYTIESLGKGVYLVGENKPKDQYETTYKALYKGNVRMTENLFRAKRFSEFKKDSNFLVIGYKELSRECVINTDCEVVFENKSPFDYIGITGNIACLKKEYYNLFTGEVICETKYGSEPTITTDKLLFVKTKNEQVAKIDLVTCEVEFFGEAKEDPLDKLYSKSEALPPKKEETLPVLKKQGRNDICRCGSGKKYKFCCGKND